METSKGLVESLKLPFPILCDADLSVIKRYAGVHHKGGPKDSDIAKPTTVIIGKNGKIKWVNQYPDVRTRPDPADLLRVLQAD